LLLFTLKNLLMIYVFKKHENFSKTMKIVRAGVGIFDKLEPEPEPHKNGPAPQHWLQEGYTKRQRLLVLSFSSA
jgi:hypothetical protein